MAVKIYAVSDLCYGSLQMKKDKNLCAPVKLHSKLKNRNTRYSSLMGCSVSFILYKYKEAITQDSPYKNNTLFGEKSFFQQWKKALHFMTKHVFI